MSPMPFTCTLVGAGSSIAFQFCSGYCLALQISRHCRCTRYTDASPVDSLDNRHRISAEAFSNPALRTPSHSLTGLLVLLEVRRLADLAAVLLHFAPCTLHSKTAARHKNGRERRGHHTRRRSKCRIWKQTGLSSLPPLVVNEALRFICTFLVHHLKPPASNNGPSGKV
jgi:hypothetical protein